MRDRNSGSFDFVIRLQGWIDLALTEMDCDLQKCRDGG